MDDRNSVAKQSSPQSPAGQSETTVLVADDNGEVRNFFRRALQRRFRVLEASNGEDAIRIARESHPNVILCDSIMPGLSAREVMLKLQQAPDTARIPFIITSGNPKEEAVGEGITPAGFLQKPFGIEDLYRTVQQSLQGGNSAVA